MARFVALLTFGDLQRRQDLLPRHREYLASLFAQGRLHESGPFVDQQGAMIVYEAESAEAVQELIDADPYSADGILTDITVREWNRVFPAG